MKSLPQTVVILILFLLLCDMVNGNTGPTAEDVKNVLDLVGQKTDRRLRPLVNQSQPIVVSLTFHILTITDLDEVQQKFSCTGWLDISWKDEFMTWNKSEYNGVGHVFPSSDSHWIPILAVSNSYNEMRPLGQNAIITKAFSDGIVYWYPADSFTTVCTVDITKYPYDTQTCILEFFPWGRGAEEIMMKTGYGVALYNYRENGEWELIKADMKPVMMFAGEEYISFVDVTFIIRRRPTFFVLNVILPILLLSLLNVLVFIFPVECGERVSYAVTVLLAMAVFLSFISETMPKTAESTSFLSVYMTIMLIVSAGSVAGSILTLVLLHRDNQRPVPKWLCRLVVRRQRKIASLGKDNLNGSSPTGMLKREVETSWPDVSRCLDRVLFAICMLVVIPSTAMLMIMIFVV